MTDTSYRGPVPTSVLAGVTPHWTCIAIFDATTGEAILGVREADATTGRLVRNEIDENGNLVVEDDQIKTIEETRALRIAWKQDPVPPASGDTAAAGDGEHDA